MGSPQCEFSHELKDDLSEQKPYCNDCNCMASPQCGFSHELKKNPPHFYKSLVAVIATIGILPIVASLLSLKTKFKSKSFIAMTAIVWLLPRVGSFVI